MQDTRKQLDYLIDSAVASLSIPGKPTALYDPVRYTMGLRGKGLRPILVLLTTGMCGGKPEKALSAAVAIELLHNFTLIHDDIMDYADIRRGKPSVHVKWNNATAILSGDVMFALALKQLNDDKQTLSDREKVQLMSLFLDTIQTVCEGQALDMVFEERDDVGTDEYMEMIKAKTAALIRCSMEFGARLAGADEQKIQLCGDIGDHAGIAFQIQDDLLDVTGDSSRFGKKAGGDIVGGKKTFLSILAFERAGDTDRMLLEQISGNKDAGESEILRAIRIYHDLGVIDEAVKAVAHHYNKALQKLAYFEDSWYHKEIKVLLDKLKVRDQ